MNVWVFAAVFNLSSLLNATVRSNHLIGPTPGVIFWHHSIGRNYFSLNFGADAEIPLQIFVID